MISGPRSLLRAADEDDLAVVQVGEIARAYHHQAAAVDQLALDHPVQSGAERIVTQDADAERGVLAGEGRLGPFDELRKVEKKGRLDLVFPRGLAFGRKIQRRRPGAGRAPPARLAGPDRRRAPPRRNIRDSEVPCGLAVDAAFDLLLTGGGNPVFHVQAVQEILADDRQLELAGHMPGEPGVQLAIARSDCRDPAVVDRERVDPAEGGVELDAGRASPSKNAGRIGSRDRPSR